MGSRRALTHSKKYSDSKRTSDLSSGRGFLRSKVLRVTATSGDVVEFVVSPGHAWEWRQALGEWTAARGRIAGAGASLSDRVGTATN